MRKLLWILVALIGAFAVGGIALHRGETINAMWIVVAAVCVYAIGYRFYSAWIAARVLSVDPTRATPAMRLNNGRDFVPTHRWIVFGHHFAAIAGPGPLIGPTLAAQFGYLPGTLWILVGAVLGGCVQDMTILFLSTRRNGRSLGQMARDELGPVGGYAAMIGTLMIMIILIAVLGLVVVNAMKHSPWATATVFATIPIAMLIGLYLRNIRPGRVLEGSLIGVALLLFAVVGGGWVDRASDAARAVRSRRQAARVVRHRLRLHRRGAAGVAAARAARLSVDVPEARHGAAAGDRRRRSCARTSRCRRSRSSSTAPARSSAASCSRSCSSPSPAARSPASMRWCRAARRRS